METASHRFDVGAFFCCRCHPAETEGNSPKPAASGSLTVHVACSATSPMTQMIVRMIMLTPTVSAWCERLDTWALPIGFAVAIGVSIYVFAFSG